MDYGSRLRLIIKLFGSSWRCLQEEFMLRRLTSWNEALESVPLFIATLPPVPVLNWTWQSGPLPQTGHKGKDSVLMKKLPLSTRLWQRLLTCLLLEKATCYGVCSIAYCASFTGCLFSLTALDSCCRLGNQITTVTWFLKLTCHDVTLYLSPVLLENRNNKNLPFLCVLGETAFSKGPPFPIWPR